MIRQFYGRSFRGSVENLSYDKWIVLDKNDNEFLYG